MVSLEKIDMKTLKHRHIHIYAIQQTNWNENKFGPKGQKVINQRELTIGPLFIYTVIFPVDILICDF